MKLIRVIGATNEDGATYNNLRTMLPRRPYYCQRIENCQFFNVYLILFPWMAMTMTAIMVVSSVIVVS